MDEVERRLAPAVNERGEPADVAPAVRLRLGLGLAPAFPLAEVPPRVADRTGSCADVRVGEQQVQVHDSRVRRQRARVVAGSRVELLGRPRLLLAELRWAQVCQRLDHVEPVRPAEEGEEVVAVIGEDRKRALLRGSCPVRIAGTACSVCGCTVVALRIPRGVPRETGEVGEASWRRRRCLRSIREIVGNSSKTIRTTGVRESTFDRLRFCFLGKDEAKPPSAAALTEPSPSACSSGDRARASGARGRRFDSCQAHLRPFRRPSPHGSAGQTCRRCRKCACGAYPGAYPGNRLAW